MGKEGTKLGRGLRWILRERWSMSFSRWSFLKASLWYQWASLLLP